MRKLEYLLADALQKGADTIITCGGVQSNHCRATTLASARLGLKVLLLLRGEPSSQPDGNLFFDQLGGAQIVYITPEEYYHHLPQALERAAEGVRARGGKPYIIPEGGSNPLGAWGYVEATRELRQQCRQSGVEPKSIVLSASSGGTQAGVLVGTRLEGWRVQIYGACVSDNQQEIREKVFRLAQEINLTFSLNLPLKLSEVLTDDRFLGEGYGLPTPDVLSIIGEVARTEGVILDPVYTGKAAHLMREYLSQNQMPTPVVFWHTGGAFGLFPFRHLVQEMTNGR